MSEPTEDQDERRRLDRDRDRREDVEFRDPSDRELAPPEPEDER